MSFTARPSEAARCVRELHIAALIAAVLVSGCATAGNATQKEHNPDPLEGFNRGVYKFNDALDRHALKPVARAYREHVPGVVQTGIGNFFTNLMYPSTVVNQFLQGKFKEGGQDTLRFVINTTLGWAGFIDVASGAKLPVHDEDSGQTLGRWGVPSGPYLVIPLLGPATVRDAPARIADDFYQPFHWYNADNERWFSLALQLVDSRARLLPLDRMLSETYDPYAFVRDAYLQRRVNAVYDGDPPPGVVDDADDADWAEEAIKEDEAAAGSEPAATGAGGPDANEAGEPDTNEASEPDAGGADQDDNAPGNTTTPDAAPSPPPGQ